MNKIVAILISAMVAATAFAQTTPADAATATRRRPHRPPAPPPDAKAKPDQGVRKLSRRERKDRIKNLSEKYRQFLTDVDPIMNPAELDTFLILETDPQRDIYITEFWRRRDVAHGTTNHAFRDEYYERLETVKEEFTNASSDRGRIFLIHGQPDGAHQDRLPRCCSRPRSGSTPSSPASATTSASSSTSRATASTSGSIRR